LKKRLDLTGKVALVVGAETADGRKLAIALAEAGADVAVTGGGPQPGEEVRLHSWAKEIWSLGRRGFEPPIDSSGPAQLEALKRRVITELGRLDILVEAFEEGRGPDDATPTQ